MRQRAKVLLVEGNNALVEVVNPGSACGNCNGCMRLTGDNKTKDNTLEVSNSINAKVGEWVVIENQATDLIKTSIVMYGTPILGLFLGYLITYLIWRIDEIAAIGAFSGLIIFAFLTRFVAKKLIITIHKPYIVASAYSQKGLTNDLPAGCPINSNS